MATLDLDLQVGAPRTFRFAGREFLVSGITPYMLGRLTAHLKEVMPHPLEQCKAFLKGDVFTPEERKDLIARAMEEATPKYEMRFGRAIQVSGWPTSFESQAGQDYFIYGQGVDFFLYIILTKHQSDFTLAEARRIAPLFDLADFQALMRLIGDPGGDAVEEEEEADAPGDGLPEGMVDPKG